MKLVFRLYLVFYLPPFFAIAQSNYKPGYVVTLKGDTMRGFIDYREWDTNPKTVTFKSFPENEVKKFTAGQINGFVVSSMAEYQRYGGPISMDPINIATVIEERDTTYKIDTVFLELLSRGKNVALYDYSDKTKTRYYISEGPDLKPVELVYRLYYDTKNVTYTTGKTVNENTYQKQLFALAAKYNMLSDILIKDIEDAEYKEIHIVKIVRAINGMSSKKNKKIKS